MSPLERSFVILLTTLAAIAVVMGLLAVEEVQGKRVTYANGATVRYVDSSGTDLGECNSQALPCATVQYAVDMANSGDEIRISTGIYTDVHARSSPPSYWWRGPTIITQVVYLSKTVSLRGGFTITNWATPDPVVYPVILDAEGEGRVLFIAGDTNPTVEGLNIRGGNATGLGGGVLRADVGGGIFVHLSMPTIENNIVSDNLGNQGGGVYLDESSATLSNNTIMNNTVFEGLGGGAFLELSDATLNANKVFSNTALLGGGLYLNESPAALGQNTIIGNMASSGGGLHLGYSDSTVINNVISDNIATSYGGGLSLDNSSATLNSNVISNNMAGTGGGLDIIGIEGLPYCANVRLINNTIIGNKADNYAGGLSMSGCSATFSENRVIHNEAGNGGGLVLAGNVTLVNNVFFDNYANTTGSGIYILKGAYHFLHNTINHNRGGDGSGLVVVNSNFKPPSTTVALTNTIIASQTVGIAVSANNVAALTGVLWFNNGANLGGAGIITVANEYSGNPVFAMDGYHLSINSAAIDKAISAGVTVDIDYDPRIGTPDLGADELLTFNVKRLFLPVMSR